MMQTEIEAIIDNAINNFLACNIRSLRIPKTKPVMTQSFYKYADDGILDRIYQETSQPYIQITASSAYEIEAKRMRLHNALITGGYERLANDLISLERRELENEIVNWNPFRSIREIDLNSTSIMFCKGLDFRFGHVCNKKIFSSDNLYTSNNVKNFIFEHWEPDFYIYVGPDNLDHIRQIPLTVNFLFDRKMNTELEGRFFEPQFAVTFKDITF